jgi:hypothetical protein
MKDTFGAEKGAANGIKRLHLATKLTELKRKGRRPNTGSCLEGSTKCFRRP